MMQCPPFKIAVPAENDGWIIVGAVEEFTDELNLRGCAPNVFGRKLYGGGNARCVYDILSA